MKKIMLLVIVPAFFILSCSTTPQPFDEISRMRHFHSMRESSSDPNWINGNNDAKLIPPGGTLTLAELTGPGRITHIWMTMTKDEKYYGKLLVLRMFWDGEVNPSVECPLNDFFCEGHGIDMYVNSLPFRVTSEGRGRNCYWPMPFAKSAKITITNEGYKQVRAFYYYIDWQKLKSLPRDELYFHACYRQEYPCTANRDYLIFEAEGCGHYVGCNLSIRQREPGWWGEGDDRFYIDGEAIPSILGTGSEDYFCNGWGIRKLDGLYYGFPISENFGNFSRHTCYRFHIHDPITFTKSIRMTIEHKGSRIFSDGSVNGYVERADDFSSVAYWYQTEPHKPFPPLPKGYKRLYEENSIIIEGESLVENTQSVGLKPVIQQLGGWSGDAQLFFTPAVLPASFTITYQVETAGKFTLLLKLTNSYDYGIYRVYLDGKRIGPDIDLFNKDVIQTPLIELGTCVFAAGQHDIRFEATAKNKASKGYFFGLDFIKVIPLE